MATSFISKEEARKLISLNLQNYVSLPEQVEVDIADSGQLLLTPGRFDLVTKYIYAYYITHHVSCAWVEELYDDHIGTFNNYYEADESQKRGIIAFKTAFRALLDDIQSEGFDASKSAVPIGENGVPCDGAHRIAACALFNKTVCTIKVPKTDNYDYLRFIEKGFGRKWMDLTALEYCKLNRQAVIVNIFPSALGKQSEIIDLLQSAGSIFYAKDVYLSGWGPTYFIKQVYKGEPWVGDSKSAFSGAQNKAANCFNSKGALRAFVFVPQPSTDLLELKRRIRDLFNIGNHSIHINDTHEETIRIARILFNKNSLFFLNHVKYSHFEKFETLFRQLKQEISDNRLSVEDICIDGSSVMSAYGMREGNDLDYIHHRDLKLSREFKEINSHNEEAHHYVQSIDDLLYNPDSYFFYDNMKFISIDVIREMKLRRGEEKDVLDVKIIDSHLKNKFWLRLDLEIMRLRRRQYLIRQRAISGIKRRLKPLLTWL